MERLQSADPAKVAGYRLLGRLGAGGMGVVYLARSTGGALVALKVIQAEYAQDAGFRQRFRREVETAGRVSSAWAVPVVDAEPDAETPWLATPFVPGPSLAEAVAAHGPLPVLGLRVLGARLAEALRDIHAAGLVHRDVKPGNVLLALDGPRLIDFGIAHAPEETALTVAGMVVGTPGFLSPEQAEARDSRDVKAPSDVFSLGCVLAFAATGRPPFGTGAFDALQFRTVHDAPDLDGVPEELLPAVRGCLEKDAERRPTAAALAEALSAGVPAGDNAGTGGPVWLPEPVTRLIAERSAAGLAFPDIEATEVSAAEAPLAAAAAGNGAEPAGTGRGTSRRRFLLLAGGATVVAAGGGLAAWQVSGNRHRARTAGRTGSTLGLQADLSGDQKAVGRAQERGLRLAVEEFNARKGRPFQVDMRVLDDGGDPGRAEKAARRMAADPSVIAVVGPTTDTTAETALAAYDAALLPVVAVSPGALALSTMGFRSFFQARPQDMLLAFFLSAHLRRSAQSRRIGVVDDRAAGAYAFEISSTLCDLLRRESHPAVPEVASPLRADFGPAVDALLDGGADSVVFAGRQDRAALIAKELHSRSFTGARAAGHAVLDDRFLAAAGEAAEGWVVFAPVIDASAKPEARAFAAAHRRRYGTAPAPYAAEAYDAAQLILSQLRDLPADSRDRGTLTTRLRSATHQGITKRFAFNKDNGALVIDGTGVHRWKVAQGRFRYEGPAPLGGSG